MEFYALIVGVVVVIILLSVYISNYNKIKRARNQIDNAYSSLDALFIKRTDMIPNLVSVVKKYSEYESDILQKLVNLRQPERGTSDYMNNDEADKLLKQLMVQVENYPALQANQQFLNLQYGINECEEQIAAGRRYLSASITGYNNTVTTFPGNIVGGMCGMRKYEWERATASQRQNVNVDELLNK